VAGAFCSAALAGLGFTPPGQQSLAWLWGNDQELLKVALPVVQLCAPVPLLVAVQNCLQGFLVVGHRTPDVTWATLAGTLTTLGTAWVLCANGVEAGVSGACSMLVGFSLEVGLLAHLLTSRR
jgi:O-antigen/teichoic acid export membrane protein